MLNICRMRSIQLSKPDKLGVHKLTAMASLEGLIDHLTNWYLNHLNTGRNEPS